MFGLFRTLPALILCILSTGLLFSFSACQKDITPEEQERLSRLFPIVKDGKWGFMNYQGKVIIEPQFEPQEDVVDILPRLGIPKRAYVVTDSSVYILESSLQDPALKLALKRLWAYDLLGQHFNMEKNEFVVNRRLRPVGEFDDTLAPVRLHGKWGYINKSGEMAIPFQYDVAKSFSQGLAAVYQSSQGWSFITHKGTRLSADKYYEEADSFSADGLARVRVNGKWGIINTKGKWVVKPKLPFVGNYSEGRALFKIGARTGFINTSGALAVPPKFHSLSSLSGGLAAYQTDKGWWGYIDAYGTPAIDPQFDDANPFSEGMASVRIGQHYGYTNSRGTLVISPTYIQAFSFKEGLAPVKKDVSWGYIDPSGKMVIPSRYDWAYPFRSGIAPVEVKGQFGYIDKKGNYVWEPTS